MSETQALPETVVFDAEPLIAYFSDEPGSDTVERYLTAVEGTTEGYIAAVNAAELHYIVRGNAGRKRADTVIDVLEESGIKRLGTDELWRTAADFKFQYLPALGDAFALAAAAVVDGTLLVGADDDFATVTDVPITRFRTDPA
jgi:predicted nucleic acid-binding protein